MKYTQQISTTVLFTEVKLNIDLLSSNQFGIAFNKSTFLSIAKWIKLKRGQLCYRFSKNVLIIKMHK